MQNDAVNIHTPKKNYKAWGIVIITILGLISYYIGMTSRSLFGDEWGFVAWAAKAQNRCHVSGNIFLRPLSECTLSFFHLVTNNNVVLLHIAGFLLFLAFSIIFFYLLNILFPDWVVFNLGTTLLFVISPSIFLHFSIASIYPMLSRVVLLLGTIMWLNYYRSQKYTYFAISLFLFLLSFLLYELGIGLMILISIVSSIIFYGKTKRIKISYMTPALLGIIFVIGRFFAQLGEQGAFGHQLDLQSNNWFDIAKGFLAGYKVVLLDSWVSLLTYLANATGISSNLRFIVAGLILFFYFLIGFIFIRLIKTYQEANQNTYLPTANKSYLYLLLLGLAVIGFGYFPAVFAGGISLHGMQTRLNVYPALGAALIVSTLIAIISKYLRLRWANQIAIYIAILIPIVILGSGLQIKIQKSVEEAWKLEKHILKQIIEEVPNIDDNTNVVLILGNYEKLSAPLPLDAGSWGFSSTLDLFYEKNNIRGEWYYEGIQPVVFTEDGLTSDWNKDVIPYDNLLLLFYDYGTGQIKVLNNDPGVVEVGEGIFQLNPNLVIPEVRPSTWLYLLD